MLKENDYGFLHNLTKETFEGLWDSVVYSITPGITPFPLWMCMKFAEHINKEKRELVRVLTKDQVEITLKGEEKKPVSEAAPKKKRGPGRPRKVA